MFQVNPLLHKKSSLMQFLFGALRIKIPNLYDKHLNTTHIHNALFLATLIKCLLSDQSFRCFYQQAMHAGACEYSD